MHRSSCCVTVGAIGNHQVRRSKDIDDMERLDAEEEESVTAVGTQLLHNDITPDNVFDGVHLQMFREKVKQAQKSKEKEIASTVFSTNSSSSTPLGGVTDHQDHIKIMEEEQDEMRP